MKRQISEKTIIIIEDHPVMREGLAAWFTATGRWQVIGKASSITGAKELLADKRADIVLLDIQLEDGWGLDLLPWLSQQNRLAGHNGDQIIAVYTAFDDYAHASAALGLGVRAYICKQRSESELEEALFAALEGGTYIDKTAQAKLQSVKDIVGVLTKREAEILSLVKSGLSNKQIAVRLGISRRTVENILSCVYDKTGIRSRLELERL